jgi:hypothetical protein
MLDDIEVKYTPPNPAEWGKWVEQPVNTEPMTRYSEYCVKCGHVRRQDADVERLCQKCNTNSGWVKLLTRATQQTDQNDLKPAEQPRGRDKPKTKSDDVW